MAMFIIDDQAIENRYIPDGWYVAADEGKRHLYYEFYKGTIVRGLNGMDEVGVESQSRFRYQIPSPLPAWPLPINPLAITTSVSAEGTRQSNGWPLPGATLIVRFKSLPASEPIKIISRPNDSEKIYEIW